MWTIDKFWNKMIFFLIFPELCQHLVENLFIKKMSQQGASKRGSGAESASRVSEDSTNWTIKNFQPHVVNAFFVTFKIQYNVDATSMPLD